MRRFPVVRRRFVTVREWVGSRAEQVDRPWVWPVFEIVGTLVAGLCVVAGWVLGPLLFVVGAAITGISAYFAHRRGTKISTLIASHKVTVEANDRQVADLRDKNEALVGELEVSEEALDRSNNIVDKIIERFIYRKYEEHDFTADERITWLLVRGEELEVVGRHCHDGDRSKVGTTVYEARFGLIGWALNRREVQRESYATSSDMSYRQWQRRSCRLPADADQLTMESVEYRVVPVQDHSESRVLGVIVLESLRNGPHLDKLETELVQDGADRKTVRDVLAFLAEMPKREGR